MITKILLVFGLMFSLAVSSQAQTWKKVNENTYAKDIMGDGIATTAHARLWLRPQDKTVQFTLLLPCPSDSKLFQVISWREGAHWASGASCSGQSSWTNLPIFIEQKLYPLPSTIEAIRKKPNRTSVEKLI